ncbi:MAG: ATP-binding protein [Thermodesulfobacteriota bacterium]
MADFLKDQMDYVLFFYGLSFALLAIVCWFLSRRRYGHLPWRWLGLFAAAYGVSNCLRMAAMSTGHDVFLVARLGLMILAFVLLVEFGRTGMMALRGRAPGRWVFIPLLCLAALGGFAGLRGLLSSARYTLGLAGGLWAAWVLFHASKARGMKGRPLAVAGLAMACCGLAMGMVVEGAPFFPASAFNRETFLAATGVPIQLIRGILAVIVAITIAAHFRAFCRYDADGDDCKWRSCCMPRMGLALLFVLAGGWALTEAVGRYAEADIRFHLLTRVKTIADTVDLGHVMRLTSTPADIGTPDYNCLKGRLINVRNANPDCRFVYLMAKRDGKVVFLADSEPEESPDYSPPGQIYGEASPGLLAFFTSGEPFVEGPLSDRWGDWVSGFSPVRDPRTGRVLAAVGIDIDAGDWQRKIIVHRLAPITITMLAVVLLIGFFVSRERLLAAKEQAEAASRAKSEFLAMMSHEIRTPMNGVLGVLGLALDGEMPSQQREYLTMARSAADSLHNLLNDILDFSRIEAGKLVLEKTDFNFRSVINSVVDLLRLPAKGRGLELRCDIPDDVPDALSGDAGRLRQILLNLIGNAVKFTKSGYILISTEVEKKTASGMLLHFLVKDTGIGIPKDKLETIFEAFTQADASNNRRYGGVGLGLSISRRLVEMMGGSIWVESEEGRGSIFHFTVRFGLPRGLPERESQSSDRLSEAREGTAATPHTLSKTNFRILLAEDDLINQEVARGILLKHGHRPTVVSDGKAAVEMWEKGYIDLIFMDIQMPVMDGFEATRLIREKEKATGAHIPIIAMTASALKGDRERCLEASMDGYISKPVKAAELLQLIEATVVNKTAKDRENSYFTPSVDVAAGNPPAESKALDVSGALDNLGGDVNLLKEVTNLFLEKVPFEIQGLGGAISSGDERLIERHAHKIKGMAVNIGAKRIADSAFRIELAIRKDDISGCGALFERMGEELEAFKKSAGEADWNNMGGE